MFQYSCFQTQPKVSDNKYRPSNLSSQPKVFTSWSLVIILGELQPASVIQDTHLYDTFGYPIPISCHTLCASWRNYQWNNHFPPKAANNTVKKLFSPYVKLLGRQDLHNSHKKQQESTTCSNNVNSRILRFWQQLFKTCKRATEWCLVWLLSVAVLLMASPTGNGGVSVDFRTAVSYRLSVHISYLWCYLLIC